MKHFAFTLCCFFSMFSYSAYASLEVKTFTLSNGMTVWINEDHDLPKVYGAVVVNAGAKDCPATGIAHYFEHIMFKGTEKIGTVDYAAEKPYLDSISVMYDRLAAAASDIERVGIQKEINRLNILASNFAIPNEFSNLISICGGSDLNAYTSQDVTVYHNQFVSTYLEQWAELNSERLIDPVFRLFQSELETVYEEKNRQESKEMSAFSQMITAEGFKGSAYQYPVIGTTENLKTPRLSEMTEFFDRYYVADNMGVMLTGDVNSEEALPILEKTFGRIRKGVPRETEAPQLDPFSGRQEVKALAKIPVVKLNALCFRAPSKKDEDCLPLSLLAFMLNNSEGIGMLDKLMADHKLSAAICLYPDLAFDDAAVFPILIMPKLLFQRSRVAEKRVLDALGQLKSGDFSDEYFTNCKLTFKKNRLNEMENLSGRMSKMVEAYQAGKDWGDVLREAERIDALTKEDMVSLANKYLGDDYLVVTKKYGNPEKDNLQKPPYKKVSNKNTGAVSSYAQAIIDDAGRIAIPQKTLDFENDVETVKISDLVTLYTIGNKVNDIFRLSIQFPVGTQDFPALSRVAEYVSIIGTESMSYEEHRQRMQALGASLSVTSTVDRTSFDVTGFDGHFSETMTLVADLLRLPKGDKSKISILKESDTMGKVMLRRDLSELTSALVEYAVYGEKSAYLMDKGTFEDNYLLSVLSDIQKYECDILYSGTLPASKVAAYLNETGMTSEVTIPHPLCSTRPCVLPDTPQVFFLDKKNTPQTSIHALVKGDLLTDIPSRYLSVAFAEYLGGDMGSVLFQEVREIRSLAYSTRANNIRQGFQSREIVPDVLDIYAGTQGDKTMETVALLDSLLHHLPLTEQRTDLVRKSLQFGLINGYPSFRNVPRQIANYTRQGLVESPTAVYNQVLEGLSSRDIERFWKEHVLDHNVVWVIVGDSRKMDMEELSKYGKVRTFKAKEIMKETK